MRKAALLAAVAFLAGTGAATAQMAEPPRASIKGYLPPESINEPRILPAPPQKGSPRAEADRAVFRETRALAGTPRYEAAIVDAKEGVENMLPRFSCALGAEATPAALPKLAMVLERATADVFEANNTGKAYFKRERPPASDPGAVCVALTAADMTRDYPSGHATRGWLYALLLTELAPDRGDALLTRGRSFGESRVVCGVHNATAIEAGRVVGAVVVANLHGDAAFRADMDAARAEMASFRVSAKKPDAGLCEREMQLLEPSPF
jgi:acid phosphatase (class A)